MVGALAVQHYALMANPKTLPDRLTILAFAGVVLVGGANIVAVRFTNGDIAPFFGAGTRFGLAGVLLLAIAFILKVPTPRRSELVGIALYGLFAFGGAMALAYLALERLPAGVAGVVFSSVPIITLFLAWAHGIERPGWRAFSGALLTIGGIWILLNQGSADFPLLSALAMFGSAACFAEAGIVVKKFRPCHPIASNGLAMTIGAAVLFAFSMSAGEHWSLPTAGPVWVALGYMVLVGSMGLFALYLYVLRGWTASGASYQFVLIPLVTALLGALFLDESIGGRFVVGGIIVLIGVYLGALSVERVPQKASLGQEAQALRCSTT